MSRGGSGFRGGFGAHHSNSAVGKPVVPRSANQDTVLQVLDMGLDFRSYQDFLDQTGQPIIGNVVSFPIDKVADTFEPTVGLLVTVLHMYSITQAPEVQKQWLSVYQTLQRVCLEFPDFPGREHAEASIRLVETARRTDSPQLFESLVHYLDLQSGIRGSQAPSQRRVPTHPKGTFCNLQLSDHKCNQEFSCNQIHLHESGTEIRHRIVFHLKLIDMLQKHNIPQDEILHRVQDSLLFAKFGNRVTVRVQSSWAQFFKTSYTSGRLDHALRRSTTQCGANGGACKFGQSCRGLHLQDPADVRLASKPLDLPNPVDVAAELERESLQLLERVQSTSRSKASAPPPSTSVLAQKEERPNESSPTTERWSNTVRDYVRNSGIQESTASAGILRTLQEASKGSTAATPPTPDSMTPLLQEVKKELGIQN